MRQDTFRTYKKEVPGDLLLRKVQQGIQLNLKKGRSIGTETENYTYNIQI